MAGVKKIYFGTNTKMYKTIGETVSYLQDLMHYTSDLDMERIQLFVIPSFTALEKAVKTVKPERIAIGAQNMGWGDAGPLTGEISPVMLEEIGVSLVMIGHSERRNVLNETDEQENRKVLCAISHGFTVLLCIGETSEEKQNDVGNEALRRQLKIGLKDLDINNARNIWIGYEPVWAIGENGEPASADYVREKHLIIKKTLKEIFGKEAGEKVPVLYGGSVNNQNAVSLIQTEGVDGLFIGRSAWDAENFGTIIHEAI